MNRFQKKRSGKRWRTVGSILVTALVFGGCWMGIQSISIQTRKQQKISLENAIRKDMVQCYAMEGHYPESLEYLEEHYGLTWDKDHFLVAYEVLGTNMMPDVTVIERGK